MLQIENILIAPQMLTNPFRLHTMKQLKMGEFGNAFLASQQTVSDNFLSHGSSLRFAGMKDALRAVVGEGSNR